MTRRTRVVASTLAFILMCAAHVGSPDAWFDGHAGPYAVLVHVQAPTVVPGIAIVNVRVTDADARKVTAFVNTFDAKGGIPPADVASPVADNPGWYRTRLWVMAGGSNSVTVGVEGQRGTGSVVVPLVALAEKRLPVSPLLAGGLVVVGVVMVTGLLSILGAAVRESVLPPGQEPDAQRRSRARRSMLRGVAVLAVILVGWGFWWRSEDRAYAAGLFTPIRMSAAVGSSDTTPTLTLTIDDTAWTKRRRTGRAVQMADLVDDHGKLVHLFMVDQAGRSTFAHLHPTTTDTVRFSAQLPPLPAGTYAIFADVVHSSGFTQTLTSTVTLSADVGKTSRMRATGDESWAIARTPDSVRSPLLDGASLTWLRSSRGIVSGAEAGLRFVLTRQVGDTLAIEPYLGMAGHAVVIKDDRKVFIHLHPLGTISLAAQARLSGAPVHTTMIHKTAVASDTLYFPYAFPQPGKYTVWVQIKRGGQVQTASFLADVASTPD